MFEGLAPKALPGLRIDPVLYCPDDGRRWPSGTLCLLNATCCGNIGKTCGRLVLRLGFRVMQCARGGCAFYFRNSRGRAHYSRALASACTPAPTTPTIRNLGLGFTPKPPSRRTFLLFASDHILRQLKAEMDWCGVFGPRELDEKKGFPTNNSPLAPCQACSKAKGRRTGSEICQSGAPDPLGVTPGPHFNRLTPVLCET